MPSMGLPSADLQAHAGAGGHRTRIMPAAVDAFPGCVCMLCWCLSHRQRASMRRKTGKQWSQMCRPSSPAMAAMQQHARGARAIAEGVQCTLRPPALPHLALSPLLRLPLLVAVAVAACATAAPPSGALLPPTAASWLTRPWLGVNSLQTRRQHLLKSKPHTYGWPSTNGNIPAGGDPGMEYSIQQPVSQLLVEHAVQSSALGHFPKHRGCFWASTQKASRLMCAPCLPWRRQVGQRHADAGGQAGA